MAREDRETPLRFGRLHGGLEWRHDAGTGSPCDVEAGHRVAGAHRGVASPLRPADDRKESDALLAKPGALLVVGELQVRLRPSLGPGILLAIESCGAEPVLPREL